MSLSDEARSQAASDMFPVRSKEQTGTKKMLGLQEAARASSQECIHKWKTFRETIEPDRTDRQIMNGMPYLQGRAYFIVQACVLCHIKLRKGLKIEK